MTQEPNNALLLEENRSNNARISDELMTARRTARALLEFPGTLPASLDQAYQIQSRSISLWDDEIVGWKVGGIQPERQSSFDASWLAGPIFARNTKKAGSETVSVPVFKDGSAALEAEYVFELGNVDDLKVTDPTFDEILSIIRACYIGVEVASSPVRAINDMGPLAVVSDFGNNYGLIYGKKIEDFSAQLLSKTDVSTYIDGQLAGAARARSWPDGPLSAVAFLIGNLRKRGFAIPVGIKVSSGALTGVHDINVGTDAVIEFASLGEIQVKVVPAP